MCETSTTRFFPQEATTLQYMYTSTETGRRKKLVIVFNDFIRSCGLSAKKIEEQETGKFARSLHNFCPLGRLGGRVSSVRFSLCLELLRLTPCRR